MDNNKRINEKLINKKLTKKCSKSKVTPLYTT